MYRLLVSAAHKSSGKTTVSIGLAAAMAARGLTVQPFKKGPDYIDPLWLAAAAGRPCRNLDFYLSSEQEVAAAFRRGCAGADVALVEGNKGLYDGLSVDGSNSNAALARSLDVPVVLVLDARGMTRGVAPLILGYQAFDKAVRIAGVILNRLGGSRHESKLRAVIEHYTDVAVLGALQEDEQLAIPERHLGLVPATEDGGAGKQIERIAAAIRAGVDIDVLLAKCAASPLPALEAVAAPQAAPGVRIGVARDRAFGFYYPDDFDALRRAGASLVFFDAIHDAGLPDVDALFIGGGFPEMLAAQLSANLPLRGQIRIAIEAGLPTYAECGGLMYLSRSIVVRDQTYPMVGALPADAVMQRKPVGRGYVHLEPTADMPWPSVPEGTIRGHEFHHSKLVNVDSSVRYAYRVQRGFGIDGKHDGLVYRNVLASYSHLRCAGTHEWAAHFVDFIRQVQRRGATSARAKPLPVSAV